MRLAAVDRCLAALVRSTLRGRSPDEARDPVALLARAEQHGVADLVFEALAPQLPAGGRVAHRARALARELDHEAHLGTLRAIDRVFADRAIEVVALKGPLLALRTWPRPAARPTTDVDLLVREADLVRAGEALALVGYVAEVGPAEERFRREHHHLHYAHPAAAPLELHFHAYRGFGRILPSEPLVARARRAPLTDLTTLGVLAPEDELVYLAAHAAAHRFVRLAWLVDIVRLVERASDAELRTAQARARAFGFATVLAFAAELAVDVLGLDAGRAALLGRSGAFGHLARTVVAEPRPRLAASATRLVYTAALCDDARAALRYAREAGVRHARRLAGRDP